MTHCAPLVYYYSLGVLDYSRLYLEDNVLLLVSLKSHMRNKSKLHNC